MPTFIAHILKGQPHKKVDEIKPLVFNCPDRQETRKMNMKNHQYIMADKKQLKQVAFLRPCGLSL
jgi:hypothetical protein